MKEIDWQQRKGEFEERSLSENVSAEDFGEIPGPKANSRREYKRRWMAKRRAELKSDQSTSLELFLGNQRFLTLILMKPGRKSLHDFILDLIDQSVKERKKWK